MIRHRSCSGGLPMPRPFPLRWARQADRTGSINSHRASDRYSATAAVGACFGGTANGPTELSDGPRLFIHVRVLPPTTTAGKVGKATRVTLTHDDLTNPDTT